MINASSNAFPKLLNRTRHNRSVAVQITSVLLLLCFGQQALAQAPAASRQRSAAYQKSSSNDSGASIGTSKPLIVPPAATSNAPEWMATEVDGRSRSTTQDREDVRHTLETLREEKRKRLEAIHERLKLLLLNPVANDYRALNTVPKEDLSPDQASPDSNSSAATNEPDTTNEPNNILPPATSVNNDKTSGQQPTADSSEPTDAADSSTPAVTTPAVTTPAVTTTDPTSAEGQQPAETTAETTAKIADLKPASPFADMIDELSGAPSTVEPSRQKEEPVPKALTATTVLSSPVDRMKLADSLFASGEHALALQMYDAIDTSKLPSADKSWLKYQQASCNRRMGLITEAESIYRQIAGESDAEWLADVSRWWLDRLSDRKELEEELGQVQNVLDTFEKAKIDANPTPQQ